jgi:hypothetical protein
VTRQMRMRMRATQSQSGTTETGGESPYVLACITETPQ